MEQAHVYYVASETYDNAYPNSLSLIVFTAGSLMQEAGRLLSLLSFFIILFAIAKDTQIAKANTAIIALYTINSYYGHHRL